MHQDGGVDLTAICMILQKGAKFLSQQNESKYPLLIRYIHFSQTRVVQCICIGAQSIGHFTAQTQVP